MMEITSLMITTMKENELDLSKLACVVFDYGMFLELALRLGRDLGKVYYASPWEDAQARFEKRVVGEGYEEIERVENFFDVLDRVDFAVFPDVYNGGLQRFLRRLGMPVWGGNGADEMETNKIRFKRTLEKLGVPIAEYEILHGVEELREHCRDEATGERWIKLSPQYRGNCETFHHVDYKRTREKLDSLAKDFGLFQDQLSFLSEKPIKSELEGGCDTYIIDGQHPAYAVNGWEKKDLAYFSAVQRYEDLPEGLRIVNDYLFPLLEKKGARQFISTEVKAVDTDEPVLLEPTIRLPSPPGEEQMELYKNLPSIIAQGAKGILVEPILEEMYACEAMVEYNEEDLTQPRSVEIPAEERQWIKLYATAMVDGMIWIAPSRTKTIGAVVGIGDSPKSALEHLKENAKALEGQPVSVNIEAIAGLLQEIEEAQDKGVFFSDKPLPKPESVIST